MNKTKTNTKVAFVVVGWNNQALLGECFQSILDQTYQDTSIIYIDNDSKDDSVQLVQRKFPAVTIIQPGRNTGFAKGNNIGIKQALMDDDIGFVALLNTDARLAPTWTENIVSFALGKPLGACYQGTTLDYYAHDVIDSTHIYVSRNGQGTQGNWRKHYTTDLGPRKVFGVNAAACLISRDFIEAQPFGQEFFDETMFMYLEDVDLAVRATIMGWDNYLVPAAHAYHMGSASTKKTPLFSLYMTFRNNSALLYKNFPVGLIIKILPQVIRGDVDTIKTLWRTNKRAGVWPVIKGRVVGIVRLPLFMAKRSKVRRHAKIDNNYLWYLMKNGY